LNDLARIPLKVAKTVQQGGTTILRKEPIYNAAKNMLRGGVKKAANQTTVGKGVARRKEGTAKTNQGGEQA